MCFFQTLFHHAFLCGIEDIVQQVNTNVCLLDYIPSRLPVWDRRYYPTGQHNGPTLSGVSVQGQSEHCANAILEAWVPRQMPVVPVSHFRWFDLGTIVEHGPNSLCFFFN